MTARSKSTAARPASAGLRPAVFRDHEAMSHHAAEWLAARLRRNPASLLCLASGGTPTRLYELIASQPACLRRARPLKLDEWGGLPMHDPATCESYFRRIFAGVPDFVERLEGFRSRPRDPVAESLRLRRWLTVNGPMDVCLLGLGVNGHLGFNEPAAMLQPFAHVAELSRASLRHAMLGSTKARPAYGLTFGIADLLAAREILLVVSGAHKREPLARLLAGRVTPRFPATFLWLHPRVTLLCDRAAMGLD